MSSPLRAAATKIANLAPRKRIGNDNAAIGAANKNKKKRVTNEARGHHVYLITPLDPKYTDKRIYIGYTNSTKHRLRQHNRELAGGARKTGGKYGPWKHVAVISGFRDKIEALRFEWICQHPYRSLCSREVMNREVAGVRGVGARGTLPRVLYEVNLIMARCVPWNEMPLRVVYSSIDYLKLSLDINARRNVVLPSHVRVLVEEGNVIDSTTFSPLSRVSSKGLNGLPASSGEVDASVVDLTTTTSDGGESDDEIEVVEEEEETDEDDMSAYFDALDGEEEEALTESHSSGNSPSVSSGDDDDQRNFVVLYTGTRDRHRFDEE